jgi:hypothetical protein
MPMKMPPADVRKHAAGSLMVRSPLVVLALVLATGVVVPLSRAHRAFPSCSDAISIEPTPRASLRRRSGSSAGIGGKSLAAGREVTAPVDATPGPKARRTVRTAAVTASAGHTHADDQVDQILDAIDASPDRAQCRPANAGRAPAAHAQAVEDVPAPPPKLAA